MNGQRVRLKTFNVTVEGNRSGMTQVAAILIGNRTNFSYERSEDSKTIEHGENVDTHAITLKPKTASELLLIPKTIGDILAENQVDFWKPESSVRRVVDHRPRDRS